MGETVPLTISDADFLARFEVTNAGAVDITAFNVGNYGGAWGTNTLESPTPSTISPGTALIPSWHFPAGTYDVRCLFADSTESIGTMVLQPLVLTHVTCPFP